MREIRLSGSVEGVVSNHDPYSDSLCLKASIQAFKHYNYVRATTNKKNPLLRCGHLHTCRPLARL